MNGNDYLTKVKNETGCKSFAEVAALIGIKPASVSEIRKGGSMAESTAEAIGKALGIDGGKVYADVRAARAKDKETRSFWNRIAGKVAALAPFVVLAATMTASEKAPALIKMTDAAISSGQYILC